jgi:serine/threonine protein kinase
MFGGQAHLFLAHDTLEARDVVVKTVPENRAHPARVTSRRLVREARILGMFRDCSHVVQLQDWGTEHIRELADDDHHDRPLGHDVVPSTTARHAWLVLPVYRHRPLGSALAEFGPLGIDVGRTVALELATVLHHLGGREVVHRDVAPGNVFLTPSGLLLADFGLAWSSRWGGEGLERPMSTGLTAAVGPQRTLGWWAPELARPESGADGGVHRLDRSAAVDVFGWGLYVFTVITGRHPWSRRRAGEIAPGLVDWENDRFRDGRDLFADVVDEIDDRCLAPLVQAPLAGEPGSSPGAGPLPRRSWNRSRRGSRRPGSGRSGVDGPSRAYPLPAGTTRRTSSPRRIDSRCASPANCHFSLALRNDPAEHDDTLVT